MNTTIKTLKAGQAIEVEVYNPKTKKCDWLTGVFNGYVTALDREFRINCTLSNGWNITEAAPECVRPI